MKKMEDYFVPWLRGQKMYVSPHIELAWREPDLKRMMSNENPWEPSPKVLEAITKYAKIANRYPDQGLVIRSQLAEINGLEGPENVMMGNGSSEIYDMLFRSVLLPGEEVVQHTPSNCGAPPWAANSCPCPWYTTKRRARSCSTPTR